MDRRRVLLVVAVLVAALGAGLVFFYAQDAEDRAAEQYDDVTVLVVTQQIARGESAEDAYAAAKIAEVQVPRASMLPTATADGSLFRDTFALTTLYPGEQLIPEKFGTGDEVEGTETLAIPRGDIAVQIALTETGKVGSFTQPGSHVAVFAVPRAQDVGDGAVAVGRASVLLPDVLVLAVGSTTTQVGVTDANGDPLPETPVTNLTLALDQDEAELVIGASAGGGASTTLYFGLLDEQSKIERDPDLDADLGR